MNSDIIARFNKFLCHYETSFILECVNMSGEDFKNISEFTQVEKCHSILLEDLEVPYAIVVYEKVTKNIASYISFSFIKGKGDYKSVIFEFSCTGEKYKRRGLSKLIRLLIITFAIEEGYTSVLSCVNKQSASLLGKYFGFEIRLEDSFEKEVFITDGLLINARLILEDKNLRKYKETYKKLSSDYVG
jgi:hypothetical protein